MKSMQKGFTLIELMIVVAIVGILAAVAIPAYQDYLKRSKMSEVAAALSACKTSFSEYIAAFNALPPDINAAGCTGAGAGGSGVSQYVQAMAVNGQTIEATIQNVDTTVDGLLLTLRPCSTDDPVACPGLDPDSPESPAAWRCGTSAPATSYKFLPATCRQGS
jgi:type IV pilus assembly protein PilA